VFGACREWLSDRRRAPAERLLRFFQNEKVSGGAATGSSFVVRQCGVFSLLFACASNVALAEHQTGWIDHGGDRGGSRFSALGLINRDNVRQLRMAWTYRTGDGAGELQAAGHAGLQATPIVLPEAAGNLLVLCTSFNAVVALDPANGRERWRFDPKVRRDRAASDYRCRGVAQWRDSELDITAACALRIFVATHDQRLYALDGLTGKSCAGFGDQGLVRLAPVIRESASATDGEEVRSYMPPAVVGNVVAVGTSFGPKLSAAAPGGEVHGFDARTGALRWSFDPLVDSPDTADDKTGEAVSATGGANAWSLMSVDEERDLVFIPTSSAAPDFFGGTRPGDNPYANSTVALRGSTGEMVWAFQTVHHDVWGRDAVSQPVLVDIRRGATTMPAVVQLTKHGFTFVLNREVGTPIFPVEERKLSVPGVAGESLAPTQPFPAAPPPLAPIRLSPADAWGFTFYDQGVCRQILERYRTGGPFLPPTLEGTVVMPGTVSGWGSGAFDSGRNLFVTNAMSVPELIRLVPRDAAGDPVDNPAGDPVDNPVDNDPAVTVIEGTPYAVEYGSQQLLSPLGLPCIAPPWHRLVAIDLGSGKEVWSAPLGSLDKIAGLPLELGAPGVGGPIVTAGGLVFIGATADEKFRAFDIDTGKKLWEAELPTSGMATPMTYAVDGRQFIVIAAGGHQDHYPQGIGDYLVAFALPEE